MSDVVGYVVQCESCGARALTLHPHGRTWMCPNCNPSGAPEVDQRSMTIAACDPLAAAIQEHIKTHPEGDGISALVGDTFFKLKGFVRSGNVYFEATWELDAEAGLIDQALRKPELFVPARTVADDADYPLGEVQG